MVVLQQSAAGSAGLRGLCDVGQVLRMAQVATAHSMEELEVGGGWLHCQTRLASAAASSVGGVCRADTRSNPLKQPEQTA